MPEAGAMLDLAGYKLQEKLSSTLYTDIYHGTCLTDKKPVIIKLPRNDFTAPQQITLQHEYYLLKQLNAPGIIQVRKLIQDKTVPVLILENLEGTTLSNYLNSKPVDIEKFFYLAMQLVDIIGELHQCGIIHKDIRPHNIFIDPYTGKLTLIDLSLATQLTEEKQEPININQLQGTLAYLSPEQTGRINRPVDHRTDFYSLGVTLFELLTGHPPFQSSDPLELVYFHIAKPAPLVTDDNTAVPAMVAAIIAKLLAKIPEERYASVIGLKADLTYCVEQWREFGQINIFELSQYDISDHLHISHKLYGRETQLKQLLDIFAYVSQGNKQLALIAGYSGIGKTSLIREIHKPILQNHGYFIQGKYDQLQRNMPYSAIINAFKNLVKQLLAEDEIQLAHYKQALLAALGDAGQIIVDIIPEISLIIGEQPSITQLNPTETEHRFNIVFQKFVQVFAQPEHPLVIFLDDLQWADNASLKLVENLLQDPTIHHLLILGAYRDNEVNAAHSLMLALQHLQKFNITIQSITLQPLQLHDIEHLLTDTLHTATEQIKSLAECLFEKTQGNPFFINQFLKILYEKQLLNFSYKSGSWQWNLHKIKQQSMMDNVIDLLTVKVQQLSPAAQHILKLAACVGHQFNLQTVVTISEQSVNQVAEQLWNIIQAQLIIPLEEANRTATLIEAAPIHNKALTEKLTYSFAHDRIQQAVYQLMADSVKQEMHLKIGRLLLKDHNTQTIDEYLFDIIDHLNQAKILITNPAERRQLAKFNLMAGIKAKDSTAYQTAKNYLQTGIDLLQPLNWRTDYELIFALQREVAACKYLTGEFDAAQIDFDQLLQNANNVLDKIDVYRLNIQMLSTLNKQAETITLGRNALRLLKIDLPEKVHAWHILLVVMKIKLQTRQRKADMINMPVMQSPEHRATVHLITELLNNAFICDQQLFILLSCMNVHYCLQHGYTESTSMATLVYAVTLIYALNWHAEGMRFVDLYAHLKERYGEANFAGKNQMILGTFINYLRYPLKESIENLLKGHQLAYDVGDILYSNYCNIVAINTAIAMGATVTELKRLLNNTQLFIKKANITDFQKVTDFYSHAFQVLDDEISFQQEYLTNQEQLILQSENNTGISFFYSLYTKLCYLLGQLNTAEHAGLQQQQFAEYSLGMICNVTTQFYYGLSLAASYNSTPVKLRKNKVKHLKKACHYLKKYAQFNPDSFQAYYFLLEAELARLLKQPAKAIEHYEKAIKSASKQNALHIMSIASECAGNFYYNDLLIPHLAKYYITEAYYHYKNWGVQIKCKALEKLYPAWLSGQIIEATSDLIPSALYPASNAQSLDMLAILKSAQAISSEIQLDKLLQKLLYILLEAAGAQRGMILTKTGDYWLLEAEGNLEQQQIYLLQSETTLNRHDLPLSLINYVQRIQEPLILHEAAQSELAMLDPYIQQTQPRSLLIMPLLYKGQLQRVLYLENASTSHVFTSQHLYSLQLLTSQATISLENAYLYYQATHDPLTTLANRSLLYQMFQYYSAPMLREQKQIAILFLDIDNFKNINDTYGHDIGDKTLICLAEQLNKCLRNSDIAIRLGGDEFIIMLTGVNNSNEVMTIAERFLQKLQEPMLLAKREINITASMGISLFPDDGTNIDTLLKHADTALYRVKETGKNQYHFYSEKLEAEHRLAHKLDIELNIALERQEFCLHYQPIFDVQTGKLYSIEVLLRWQHPERGLLNADIFIEAAEKSFLIESIGKWVIQTACRQAAAWQQQGLLSVPIAINVAAGQLKKMSLSQLISNVLRETELDPQYLELELTESTFIENTEKVAANSLALTELGVNLVLDDFGTGYSNLMYLKRLPVSKLKIDRSFIKSCTDADGKQSRTIIEAIILMAHKLDLQVVAEGIESIAQLDYLRQQQADAAQGYYLSKPLSATDCEALLKSHN